MSATLTTPIAPEQAEAWMRDLLEQVGPEHADALMVKLAKERGVALALEPPRTVGTLQPPTPRASTTTDYDRLMEEQRALARRARELRAQMEADAAQEAAREQLMQRAVSWLNAKLRSIGVYP